MEYIHLVGVEQVQDAANRMIAAAEIMRRSANEMSYAMEQHGRLMREYMDMLSTIEENDKGEL